MSMVQDDNEEAKILNDFFESGFSSLSLQYKKWNKIEVEHNKDRRAGIGRRENNAINHKYRGDYIKDDGASADDESLMAKLPRISLDEVDRFINFKETLLSSDSKVNKPHGFQIDSLLDKVVENHNQINDIIDGLSQNKHMSKGYMITHLSQANKSLIDNLKDLIQKIHDSYRKKIKVHEQMLDNKDQQILEFLQEIQSKDKHIESLEGNLKIIKADNKQLESLKKSHDLQIELLSTNIQTLELVRDEYYSYLNELRLLDKQTKRQRDELSTKLKAEEDHIRFNDIRSQVRDEIRRLGLMSEKTDNQTTRKQYLHKQQTIAVAKRVDAITQTELPSEFIDLWDQAGGWVLPVSSTALARARWRRSARFASCSSCRGQGYFIAKAAELLRASVKGEYLDWVDEDGEEGDVGVLKKGGTGVSMEALKSEMKSKRELKPTKKGELWTLPDQLMKFLAHVPKNVLATTPYSTGRVLGLIWGILALKGKLNYDDDRAGAALEPINDFLIETFLRSCDRRDMAENQLFLLLQGVAEHRSHNGLIHLFGRMVGAIKERKSSTNNNNNITRVPNVVLTIYLIARERLMRPYRGRFKAQIEKAKQTNPELTRSEESLHLQDNVHIWTPEHDSHVKGMDLGPGVSDPSLQMWWLRVPSHIVVTARHRFYCPVDRVLHVLRHVLTFLNDDAFTSFSRLIEKHSRILSSSGTLEPVEASHSAIRYAIRRIIQQSNANHKMIRDRKMEEKRRNQNLRSQVLDEEVAEELVESPPAKSVVNHRPAFDDTISDDGSIPDSTDDSYSSVSSPLRSLNGMRSASKLKLKSLSKRNLLSYSSSQNLSTFQLNRPPAIDTTAPSHNLSNISTHQSIRSINTSPRSTTSTDPSESVSQLNRKQSSHRLIASGISASGSHSYSSKSMSFRQLHPQSSRPNLHKSRSSRKSSFSSLDLPDDLEDASEVLGGGTFDTNEEDDEAAENRRNYEESRRKCLVADVDAVLLGLVEEMIQRNNVVDDEMKRVYREGDVNGDGILEFSEFVDIITKVAPQLPQRRILHMFRDALLDRDNKATLEASAFIDICRRNGLLLLVDPEEIADDDLLARALSCRGIVGDSN